LRSTRGGRPFVTVTPRSNQRNQNKNQGENEIATDNFVLPLGSKGRRQHLFLFLFHRTPRDKTFVQRKKKTLQTQRGYLYVFVPVDTWPRGVSRGRRKKKNMGVADSTYVKAILLHAKKGRREKGKGKGFVPF
jgi:hypothetical protein